MAPVVDTLRLTAEEAAGLLERGELSAGELRGAYLDAIADRDGELHCFLRTVDEAQGEGVPIALKDVISTKGVETTAGSRILSGYVPVFDATVAARVKEAGLSLHARTACPSWLGERLDLVWAIDVLHPLAGPRVGNPPG